MGKVIEKPLGYSGGREGQLVSVAWLVLILGILGAVTCVILAIVDKSALWFVLGLGSLLEGVVLYVAFQAVAEVIRLLKMENGLHFGGEVMTAKPTLSYVCSECGKSLQLKSQSRNDVIAILDALVGVPQKADTQTTYERPKTCPHCGAVLND